MRRLLLLAVPLLLLMAVPAQAATVTLDQRDHNAIVKLGPGDALELRLQGNSGSTGYSWRTTDAPNSAVLVRRSSRTIPASACGAPTVGCPTTQVITYVARRRGRTRFTLAYVPPGGGTPARRFRAEVRVGGPRSTPAGPVRPACLPAGARSVAVNRAVRVYESRSGAAKVLYACDRASSRRTRLATAEDDGFVTSSSYSDVRLAGRFVAWRYTATDNSCKADCPPDYQATTQLLRVFDVGSRTARNVEARPLPGALVLSERGGLAWAARPDAAGPVEIHASPSGGGDRLLDSGDIDPASLAIERTIVSWTRDGAERYVRVS